MRIKRYLEIVVIVASCVTTALQAQPVTADGSDFESAKLKAEAGDAAAQYSIGCMYFNGHGVGKDLKEAAYWFQKAADQGSAYAQRVLASMYSYGEGVAKDDAKALDLNREAAAQADPIAECDLGVQYRDGQGVETNFAEAAKWFRKASNQGLAAAEYNLGVLYVDGSGVEHDFSQAAKLFQKAANQGFAKAQENLSICYGNGDGVPRNYLEAYKWECLAAAQGEETAKAHLSQHEHFLTPDQVAEAQREAAAFVPRPEAPTPDSDSPLAMHSSRVFGTGFCITDDGYFVSNFHVIKDAAGVQLVTTIGTVDAKVVQTDAANDLALLKADGQFAALPIASSRKVALGNTVATVGFPDPNLQGFSPKLAKGEIAGLAGVADDARYFQISLPIQPGNSGGALVDEHGNVVGVVSAKLNAAAALAASGSLPENVNYAVKSSFLLSFLESVPALSDKLKEPSAVDRKFEDVVKSVQDATVLVLVK